MIDISPKKPTLRYARASGRLKMKKEVMEEVRRDRIPKGNVMEVARAAGIQAAKKTPEWLVFCHNLPLEWVEIAFEYRESAIEVSAEVRATGKTGFEMEALTAVSAALLNMYDMLKPLDPEMEIESVRLVKKTGGKSDWPPVISK